MTPIFASAFCPHLLGQAVCVVLGVGGVFVFPTSQSSAWNPERTESQKHYTFFLLNVFVAGLFDSVGDCAASSEEGIRLGLHKMLILHRSLAWSLLDSST